MKYKNKYILQYGNIAAISYYSAVALRKIGLESKNVVANIRDFGGTDQEKDNRQLPFDEILNKTSDAKIFRLLKRFDFCRQTIRDCNLIHYHGGTILPKNIDSTVFQYAGIPMLISWAGGDARIISLARKNNPYFYKMPDEFKDNRTRNHMEAISRHVRYVATDPEMAEYCLPYFEKVFIVQQPMDLSSCYYQPARRKTKSVIILHIPTHREVKGTAYIETAIERLKSDGLSFEFRLLAPTLTQDQVRKEIAKADIYVDELRCGSYGITAIEAMASGKPTLTYIREDLVEKYPHGLPLVNANPDTIYTKLKELILDEELRFVIGKKSREYVEKYHSLEVIGPKLLEIYQEIGLKL
jgi:hypothetical protein